MTESIESKFYSNIVKIFLGTFAFVSLLIGAFVFTIDPYLHYRKSELFKPVYKKVLTAKDDIQRFQLPGVVNYYDFDSVITGSSTATNFVPSKMNKILKKKFIKLSMIGAGPSEIGKTLDYSLQTGKVTEAIISLDFFTFANKELETNKAQFLWNQTSWDDYLYLMSERSLLASIENFNVNFVQEQRTKNKEQRTKNKEQRTKNKEQRTKS